MRLTTELTTQCPECGGQFAVSMAQLQLRKGFVRCVHCAHIFDGYETVVPENGDTLVLLDPSTASDQPAVIRQRHGMTVPRAGREDTVFSISDDAPLARVEHAPVILDDVARNLDTPARTRTVDAERRRTSASVSVTLPDFLSNTRQRSWAFWCWSVLSVLALLLLLVQMVVICRVQLASAFPTTRPVLERLCGAWGCQVAYPRYIDKITISSSSLRMQARTDQSQETDTHLVLHFVLRNQADHPQQWPTLRLDMTDFSGAVVIRRHLQPVDYLPETVSDKFFAGRSAMALYLPMVVQGVAVNGYQIKPFFP